MRVRRPPPSPVPDLTFRLYPGRARTATARDTRYVLVHVWATQRDMLAHARREGYAVDAHTLGHCYGVLVRRYTGDGRQWTRGVCAVVNFYRSRLEGEIVAHEFFHATMAWARRVRFDWASLGGEDGVGAEEPLAYVQGYLCAQFTHRAAHAGLYDGPRWRVLDRAADAA